jgi:hypothetical protein
MLQRILAHRQQAVAAAVGLVVLFVGVVYAATRTPTYESTAALVLAPKTLKSDELPSVLDGFTSAGTSGTFVELIASRDTLVTAGSPAVTVDVRAVPDTRVINVTATGARDVVQPGLTALLRASQSAQSGLGDVWQLKTIATPSAPARKGVGSVAIVLAAALLAMIAAAAMLALFGRLGGDALRRDRGPSLPIEPVAPMRRAANGSLGVREHVGREG